MVCSHEGIPQGSEQERTSAPGKPGTNLPNTVWNCCLMFLNTSVPYGEIHVLDKLRSCMTDSAVDCEFNTNELVMHFK